MESRPYCFRREPSRPARLDNTAAQRLLSRYKPKLQQRAVYPSLGRKQDVERARRQITKYFSCLNEMIKFDLLELLYHHLWSSYRQKHRSILDKEMLDNSLCCTYPEECSGRHRPDLSVTNHAEFVLVWRVLVGRAATNLNLLPFLDQYHNCIMVQDMMFPAGGWDNRPNLYSEVEKDLSKNLALVSNVQQLQFFATYRGFNAGTWSSLLPAMPCLQSLELHFWCGDGFFDLISAHCGGLRELILSRQRQGRATRDTEQLPGLVTRMAASLRVLVIDSTDTPFSPATAKALHKAVSGCGQLECLKLEADESPFVHWVNSRHRVTTRKLIMTLRRSFQYLTVVRNINRCFNADVDIDLTYDTYVDIDNHKHAFFSHGPITGGGENTVAASTREFEQAELCDNFVQLFSSFGPRVTALHAETDIRPEYLARLFPRLESLEMFSRASRRVPVDPRLVGPDPAWPRLTTFTMEVDPGFSSSCTDQLLVHILGDLLRQAGHLRSVKVLASQTGLRVAEWRLLAELNKLSSQLQHITTIQFLSPYRMQSQGLSWQTALHLLQHCPRLQLLRDVSSWAGGPADWERVVREARRRGLRLGWAEKTRKVSLYTIDYDSEGWVQTDTGHQFELYNNLNDDWEVVDLGNPDGDEIENDLVDVE